MATYLALCQSVAKESGTVGGENLPAAVTGQVGRLGRIVGWVNDAWQDVQRRSVHWRWMRNEFSGALASGQQRYEPSDLGVTRHAEWVQPKPAEESWAGWTIYKTADGRGTERPLRWLEWDDFYRLRLIGTHASTTGFPKDVSEDPDGKLIFYPTPDDGYTVRGRYVASPQTLSANSDVPECPERFHDAIKWRALIHLAVYDENAWLLERAEAEFASILAQMERLQRPRPRIEWGMPE